MAKAYWKLSHYDKTRDLFFLNPYPREISLGERKVDINKGVNISAPSDLGMITEQMANDLENLGLSIVKQDSKNNFLIELDIRDIKLKAEGYLLDIEENGAKIIGQDAAGLFYGIQTFLQLAGFCQGIIPVLSIRDWPLYKIRSVMLDMGRGVYPVKLIKRIIRIMARLKLNMLHLHLYDDNLMGVRFRNLPLGSENPHAISLDELSDIIEYAGNHHISVCPELESWGHVGSIIYHFPECYGAPGMWDGQSFGIGEKTFLLLEKIYNEIIPVLRPKSFVHLGLDEAKWAMLPGEKSTGKENPEWLVGRLYEILMKVAECHGKEIIPRIWSDHGGRPIPKHLKGKIIVEPWAYFEAMEQDIKEKVERFSADIKTPFIMGGGSSSKHFAGSFGATRIWCQEAKNSENCFGVNICLWEGNFFERYLISLYGGAGCAWNVAAEEICENDKYREHLYGMKYRRMLSWQTLFDDAKESDIIMDRGHTVFQGYYVSGPDAGLPVAPTATFVEGNAEISINIKKG